MSETNTSLVKQTNQQRLPPVPGNTGVQLMKSELRPAPPVGLTSPLPLAAYRQLLITGEHCKLPISNVSVSYHLVACKWCRMKASQCLYAWAVTMDVCKQAGDEKCTVKRSLFGICNHECRFLVLGKQTSTAKHFLPVCFVKSVKGRLFRSASSGWVLKSMHSLYVASLHDASWCTEDISFMSLHVAFRLLQTQKLWELFFLEICHGTIML